MIRKNKGYIAVFFTNEYIDEKGIDETDVAMDTVVLVPYKYDGLNQPEHFQYLLPGIYHLCLSAAETYKTALDMMKNNELENFFGLELPITEALAIRTIVKHIVSDKKQHIEKADYELVNFDFYKEVEDKCSLAIICNVPQVVIKDGLQLFLGHNTCRDMSIERIEKVASNCMIMAEKIKYVHGAISQYSTKEALKYLTHIRNIGMKGMSINKLKEINKDYLDKHLDPDVQLKRSVTIEYKDRGIRIISLRKDIYLSQNQLYNDDKKVRDLIYEFLDTQSYIMNQTANIHLRDITELTAEERKKETLDPKTVRGILSEAIHRIGIKESEKENGLRVEYAPELSYEATPTLKVVFEYDFALKKDQNAKKFMYFNDINGDNLLASNKKIRDIYDQVFDEYIN